MELPTREEIAHGGSEHVDTVGVTGSNPVSRTISHGQPIRARERERTSQTPYNCGRALCQSVLFYLVFAIWKRRASSSALPSNCRPIGNCFPSMFAKPHGMLIPQMPARLPVFV